MSELIDLNIIIKELLKQQNELLKEVKKLPKEHIDLVSKIKLVSDTLAQLQHQFDVLFQKAPQQK